MRTGPFFCPPISADIPRRERKTVVEQHAAPEGEGCTAGRGGYRGGSQTGPRRCVLRHVILLGGLCSRPSECFEPSLLSVHFLQITTNSNALIFSGGNHSHRLYQSNGVSVCRTIVCVRSSNLFFVSSRRGLPVWVALPTLHHYGIMFTAFVYAYTGAETAKDSMTRNSHSRCEVRLVSAKQMEHLVALVSQSNPHLVVTMPRRWLQRKASVWVSCRRYSSYVWNGKGQPTAVQKKPTGSRVPQNSRAKEKATNGS